MIYKNLLRNGKLSKLEKLVILMELLFDDTKINQIYYNRYVSTINKIKETNSEKYNKTDECVFGEVEFFNPYHLFSSLSLKNISRLPEFEPIQSNRKNNNKKTQFI